MYDKIIQNLLNWLDMNDYYFQSYKSFTNYQKVICLL